MATQTTGVAVTKPTDVGLKREMGLIGATWASETSIIGSGWLFGALFAAQAAGTAALIGWVIGGIIVTILALVHAELGGMYPVSGGTARFPHFAFGSAAGISFGFFAYLPALAVVPIECFAVMIYGSYAWPALYDPTTKNVTGLGFAMLSDWRATSPRETKARSLRMISPLRSVCSTAWFIAWRTRSRLGSGEANSRSAART